MLQLSRYLRDSFLFPSYRNKGSSFLEKEPLCVHERKNSSLKEASSEGHFLDPQQEIERDGDQDAVRAERVLFCHIQGSNCWYQNLSSWKLLCMTGFQEERRQWAAPLYPKQGEGGGRRNWEEASFIQREWREFPWELHNGHALWWVGYQIFLPLS